MASHAPLRAVVRALSSQVASEEHAEIAVARVAEAVATALAALRERRRNTNRAVSSYEGVWMEIEPCHDKPARISDAQRRKGQPVSASHPFPAAPERANIGARSLVDCQGIVPARLLFLHSARVLKANAQRVAPVEDQLQVITEGRGGTTRECARENLGARARVQVVWWCASGGCRATVREHLVALGEHGGVGGGHAQVACSLHSSSATVFVRARSTAVG